MRHLGLCVFLVVLPAFATPVRAQDDGISAKAVNRAHAFFKTAKRGKSVIDVVHMGCNYDSHAYKGYVKVTRAGKVVPGHFALVYDYAWSGDGESRMYFLCDARGNFYEMQVNKTNAVFAQPFLVANGSIKLIGEALLAAFKDDLKEADRKLARQLIDDADAKGLLEWSLKVDQALAP